MIVAWHGEPDLKAAVMNRLREHRRMDEIVQRVYYDDGKGCHLGCITHVNSNTHETAERLFGIEQRVGYWLEAVFEGLPKKGCTAWVLNGTDAIPVSADLAKCHHVFEAWLLGPSGLLTITDGNRSAIERVRELHERAANGEMIFAHDWSAAWSAAWSAEWSADPAACSAARSAAWSATWSAESAAWSAAWKKIAAKSIEIFAAAPIVTGQHIEVGVKDELCCRRLWCPDGVNVLIRS